MKVYEYAKTRNISSKDIVRKVHELGHTNIKNHLSLLSDIVVNKLDQIEFKSNKKEAKIGKNIAFVSMECAPFVSKGLGDMVKNKITHSGLCGNKTIMILPKFQLNIDNLQEVMDLDIVIYHVNRTGKVYKLEQDQVDYYFVSSEYYFNRELLYGYYDDAERFAFLSYAALEIIDHLNMELDIINVHDWPLGLFPILFKESHKETNIKIEFSVYGSTYQGIYGLEVLTEVFGLNSVHYENQTVEYAHSVNFLKAGLVTADKIDINKVALSELKKSYLKDFVYDNM